MCLMFQGSEELFSVDPLPTRSSVTPANVASYIQQSRMADLGSMDHGDQRQDDDDIVSTGDAEVRPDLSCLLCLLNGKLLERFMANPLTMLIILVKPLIILIILVKPPNQSDNTGQTL